MEVDEPFHPAKRPPTPVKTSWFEFLLNQNLLEEHLQKDSPDPIATDLIALFLYQADVAAATAKEIKDDSEPATPTLNENKKVRALKLLALKVAAHLEWNLDTLNSSIPLAMVQDILLELLKMTLPMEEEADPTKHLTLDFTKLPQHSLFAVQLYHRWCLKVILEDSFPSKPSKTQGVQVPGLEIPVLNPANGKETVMTIVKEGLRTSTNVLSTCMSTVRDVVMPTLQSLGYLDHEVEEIYQPWELGKTIRAQEIIAQICYDLGSMSFHMHNYEDALMLFKQSQEVLSHVPNPIYCNIDPEKLTGYNLACNSMSSGQKPAPVSLYDRVEHAKQNQCKDLVDVLLEDNHTKELNLCYRDTVEEHVLANLGACPIQQEVFLCNSVRRAIEGRIMSVQCERYLAGSKHNVRFTIRCVNVTMQNLTHSQAANLKTFVRYLCYKLPNELRFTNSVLEPPIRSLFTSDELQELSILANGPSKDISFQIKEQAIGTDQSDLERTLILTYDPVLIKDLVQKLLTKTSKTNIMFLSNQWRMPRELAHPIESLPIPWVQVYSHILVSKAQICTKVQLYNKSKELLQAADNTIKDISYKLAKVLRWELLKLDLLQHQETGGLSPGTTRGDVIKRCKLCVATLEGKKDQQASADIVSSAVAFLYNSKEWDHLTSLANINSGYVQLCRVLVSVSSSFQAAGGNYTQVTSSRKVAREMWEAVTNIFSLSSQAKRSGSGSVTNIQRDSNTGMLSVLAFSNFIKKIKDPVTISALISCLVKLYCMLKSDVNTEIYAEYLTLWPTTLQNISGINATSVTDCTNQTILHSRSIDVVNSSWIRTQADYCFANGDYNHALRHYLELGVLVTDYFNEQVTRNVYDEPIVKRMIKCCSSLQCHTQVAVLCQCLDDIDHSTAFKALQENNSEDAMDTFYPYIWDSTLLEYIINLHHRRGQVAKKVQAIKAISQYEVNCSNPPEILFEAAKVRKANFFRAMVKQHL